MKALFFDYPPTARIRLKFSSVLENPVYPDVLRIKTKKLDFLVPRTAVILGKTHAYIPSSLYQQAYAKLLTNRVPV